MVITASVGPTSAVCEDETCAIIEPFLNLHGIRFTEIKVWPGVTMAWVKCDEWRSGDRLIKVEGPVIFGPGSQRFDLHNPRSLCSLVRFLDFYSR